MNRFNEEMMDGEFILKRRYACPQCSEQHVANLHLADDGVAVDCATCGCVFIPEKEAEEL